MRNGIYHVRLTAEDKSGNISTISTTYQIDGEAKVGNFSLAFTDLELPMAGIPIVINRSYDSRNKDKGDFGIGWTLGIQDIKISSNYPLGKHWKFVTSQGPLGLPNYNLVDSKRHIITVTYSDGRTDEFYVKCTPDNQVLRHHC